MEGFKEPEQLAEESAIKEEEKKVNQETLGIIKDNIKTDAGLLEMGEKVLNDVKDDFTAKEEVKKTFSKNLTTVVTDLQNLNIKTKVFLLLMFLALVMAFCALGFRWGGDYAAKFFIDKCACF